MHWSLSFKLRQLQICGDEVEAWKVGLLNDLVGMACIGGITNCPIECLVVPDVEFWLQPMNCREACLGVEIHGEDPIAIEGEILCKVSGGRGFCAAALEVDATDDLKMLTPLRCLTYWRRALSALSR